MVIRPLTATDAARYQLLRLRALREHPEAFASAFEDEQPLTLETVAHRFQQSSAERYSLGAFDGEELSVSCSFIGGRGERSATARALAGCMCRQNTGDAGLAKRCCWTHHPRPDVERSGRPHPGSHGGERAGARPLSGSRVYLRCQRASLSQDWGGVC
jgi:hypothetical protein